MVVVAAAAAAVAKAAGISTNTPTNHSPWRKWFSCRTSPQGSFTVRLYIWCRDGNASNMRPSLGSFNSAVGKCQAAKAAVIRKLASVCRGALLHTFRVSESVFTVGERLPSATS